MFCSLSQCSGVSSVAVLACAISFQLNVLSFHCNFSCANNSWMNGWVAERSGGRMDGWMSNPANVNSCAEVNIAECFMPLLGVFHMGNTNSKSFRMVDWYSTRGRRERYKKLDQYSRLHNSVQGTFRHPNNDAREHCVTYLFLEWVSLLVQADYCENYIQLHVRQSNVEANRDANWR